jgi:secernin
MDVEPIVVGRRRRRFTVPAMCDSLCAFQPERTLFAKSSDRPPGEAQVIEAIATRPAGPSLPTQYLELADTGAVALLGSRPTWLWGLEHGVNAHRVAIGNEQLWTVDNPAEQPDALTGMDLVRLGLERGRTAEEALGVVTGLIDEHGQGGIGDRDEAKAYFSSFLFADPTGAWVLETSARSWAARPVSPAEGSVALSNRISLSTDWTRASADVAAVGDFDRWRRQSSPTAHADKRLAVSGPGAQAIAGEAAGALGAGAGARQLAALLRDHGAGAWGRPGDDPTEVSGLPPAVIDRLGTGVSLCMHLRGVQATTSSMIASLPRDPAEPLRAWVAPGNPCVTIFVPTFGIDGVAPELAEAATWHRFEALRQRVEHSRATGTEREDGAPGALAEIRSVLAPVETELWHEADEVAERSPAEQVAWAGGAWPRIGGVLDSLGV